MKSLYAQMTMFFSQMLVIAGVMIGAVPSYALFDDDSKMRYKNQKIATNRGVKSLPVQDLLQQGEWQNFFTQNGKQWQILWNESTNSLSRAVNRNVAPTRKLQGIVTQNQLVSESLQLVKENEPIFKVASENLRLQSVSQKNGLWYVRFNQYLANIPVYGAQLTFRFNRSGQLITFGGNIYPDLSLDVQARVKELAAIRAVAEKLGCQPESLIPEELYLVIYPQQRDDLTFAYTLCWEITVTSTQQPLGWKFFIDAKTGAVTEFYDRARYNVYGEIKGQILPKYYDDNPISRPLPNLKLLLLNKQTPILQENLDSDPGWSVTSSTAWEYGTPTSGSSSFGGPDPTGGHTGTTIYGNNLTGSYQNNMVGPEYLMTTSINCSQGQNTVLRFWRWIGVEGSDSDKATLGISSNLTTDNWQTIWNNPKETVYDGEWKLVFYDISSLADGENMVFLRWGLGETNGYPNYCGWNIDDVGIYNSVRATTDKNGNFTFYNEAQNNILDLKLDGSYFQVKNGEGAELVYTKNDIAANAPKLSLTLTSSNSYSPQTDTGLLSASEDIDEMNAYYHANYLIDYFSKIDQGFLDQVIESFPITMTVHNKAKFNESYWLKGDGIYFGDGDGEQYLDFAQFSDIIYHEVTHAITDSIYKSNPASNPRRFTTFDAMHEAFSDYWACTINNDPEVADGGFWIGHTSLRSLVNELHYRLNYGDELYQSSLILSGAMWELREKLRYEGEYGDNGIKMANTLFLLAMYNEPTTYLDFLLDVLAVDEVKYDGDNEALIREAFGHKGIAEPPVPPSPRVTEKKDSSLTITWDQVPQAAGYNIYYEASIIRASQPSSRFTQGGSSGESSGGSSNDGTMDGSDGGTNTDGGGGNPDDQNSSNSGTSGSSNTTASYDNKADVGENTSYQLTGLQSNTEYRILLTSYNEFGVESSPSRQIIAELEDPNSSGKTIYYYPVESSEKSKMSCFISSLGNLFEGSM